jgi:aspartate carbamoyltransferase catalytic subunit
MQMPKSWISLKSMTPERFQDLIQKANQIKKLKRVSSRGMPLSVALIFLEPSTRTRLSFERASQVIGASVFVMAGSQSTSIEKGESLEDTLLNIEAMQPDVLVVRCGDDFDLETFSHRLTVSLICAGWGKKAHPTQALLDAYTLSGYFDSLKGKKVLYVGDAKHSRVLSSHFELFPNLQMKMGFFCPPELSVQHSSVTATYFENKSDALNWADVVVGLRLQKERLETQMSWYNFETKYQMTREDLLSLGRSVPLMHPGPVGWGNEFHMNLKDYQKSLILAQVTNGVYLRAALLFELGD